MINAHRKPTNRISSASHIWTHFSINNPKAMCLLFANIVSWLSDLMLCVCANVFTHVAWCVSGNMKNWYLPCCVVLCVCVWYLSRGHLVRGWFGFHALHTAWLNVNFTILFVLANATSCDASNMSRGTAANREAVWTNDARVDETVKP